MSRITIEVSSTHPGEAWRAHLASKLAALHPGAEIRVAHGLVDDAFVWFDEFGFCEERESRTSIVEEFIDDGRDSFAAVVVAAEELGERVEAEVRSIYRAWSRGGGPVTKIRAWLRRKEGSR